MPERVVGQEEVRIRSKEHPDRVDRAPLDYVLHEGHVMNLAIVQLEPQQFFDRVVISSTSRPEFGADEAAVVLLQSDAPVLEPWAEGFDGSAYYREFAGILFELMDVLG